MELGVGPVTCVGAQCDGGLGFGSMGGDGIEWVGYGAKPFYGAAAQYVSGE